MSIGLVMVARALELLPIGATIGIQRRRLFGVAESTTS